MSPAVELARHVQSRFFRDSHLDPSLVSQEGEQGTLLRRLLDAERGRAGEETVRRVENEFFGWGPLHDLILNSEITEILVTGPRSIWFEKNGRLAKFNDVFLTDTTFRNFVVRLSGQIGTQATAENPFSSGELTPFRVQIVAPPLVKNYQIALRRHPDKSWSLEDLVGRGFLNKAQAETLKEIVLSRENLLVVGATSSGKTTLLAACLAEVPHDQRLAILEDTPELKLPSDSGIQMCTRTDTQGILKPVDLSDLVKLSLRLRPDRLAVGEVRGAEAKDLLMALATGHAGSFGTLHASSVREALTRLEMLIQLGAPQWSLQAIRQLIGLTVQKVAVVTRTPEGHRRMEGIYRIVSVEDFGVTSEPIN